MVEEGSEVKLAGPSSPKSPPVSTVKLASPRSPRQPRRIKLTDQQLETSTKEELAAKWREQDLYVECLEGQTATHEGDLRKITESEEKYRQKYSESSHREKVLVRRLATKEQELQEYVNQITEMKAAQTPSALALRSALLDPAVNILIQKLRQELITTKAKLEDTQNELSAWKFTPDSNTGKRLMAKCRLLYQENEELGRMIASGRIAKLEGELALQKSFSEEVKKSQSELDEFLQDLDEDVEGMQSTIYFLQQELRKARETVTLLQQENSSLKLNTSEMGLPNGLSPHTPPLSITKKEDDDDVEADEDDERDENKEIESESPLRDLDKSNSIVKLESDEREKCHEINSDNSSSLSEKKDKHTLCSEPDNIDESSSDSAALVIKIETEELDDEKDRDYDNDENEDNDVCKRMLRTKGSKSMVSGDNEANGDNEDETNLIRGRDRTKRELCDEGSDNENDKVQKKKRRASVLSLDYNETTDDTIIVTNGETLQSDPE